MPPLVNKSLLPLLAVRLDFQDYCSVKREGYLLSFQLLTDLLWDGGGTSCPCSTPTYVEPAGWTQGALLYQDFAGISLYQ